MTSRSEIKNILDTWQGWLFKTQETSIAREQILKVQPKLALAVIGVRRSGKSYLAANQARSENEVLYMNFEDPFFIQNQQVAILDQLVSVFTESRMRAPNLVLFDEIQNIEGWERWVRKMVDLQKFRLILTGSSARMLSSELATSLTGRCLTSVVWPLSFREYLSFTKKVLREADEYLGAFHTYMREGGFPEIVLTSEVEEKRDLLKQYLTDILYKDIIKRNEIRTPHQLEQLVAYYLTNPSCLHSYNGIRKAFGLNVATARAYTRSLQDAFLVFEVNRFHPNLKVQSRDPKKIYVIDTGLRNAHSLSLQEDMGKLAENVVYIELRRRGLDIFYFKNEREVDFLIAPSGKPKDAIQVCYNDMENTKTEEREISSLLDCLQSTQLEEGTILTLKREETVIKEKKKIRLIPLYKWLLAMP